MTSPAAPSKDLCVFKPEPGSTMPPCHEVLTSMRQQLNEVHERQLRMDVRLFGDSAVKEEGFLEETNTTLRSHGKSIARLKVWQITVTAGAVVTAAIMTWLFVHLDVVKAVAQVLDKGK